MKRFLFAVALTAAITATAAAQPGGRPGPGGPGGPGGPRSPQPAPRVDPTQAEIEKLKKLVAELEAKIARQAAPERRPAPAPETRRPAPAPQPPVARRDDRGPGGPPARGPAPQPGGRPTPPAPSASSYSELSRKIDRIIDELVQLKREVERARR